MYWICGKNDIDGDHQHGADSLYIIACMEYRCIS